MFRADRSLHLNLKAEMLRLLRDLAAKGETQVPPEEELSRQLGVSRATLRSVALSLQKEGILTRIHGRGTFINHRALSMGTNINQGQRFLTILQERGYQASHRVVSAVHRAASGELAQKLELDPGAEVLEVARVFEADGRPAVLAVDHVPTSYLRPDWDGEYQDSVFGFADTACTEPLAYSIAEILPVAAAGETTDLLVCREGTPLLLLEHLHLSKRDRPFILTRAFVNPDFIRFYVARTRTEV